MDNRLRAIRGIICLVLLVVLCACGAEAPLRHEDDAHPETLEELYRQIASLQAQIVVLEEELGQAQAGTDYEGEYRQGFGDVAGLLDRISASDAPLTCFPALITEAYASEAGCVLHYDRLEYNPDYVPDGAQMVLLNAEEVAEEMDASEACAQYDGRVSGEISQDFSNYIASFEDGMQFTLYMLGDELICVAEIVMS